MVVATYSLFRMDEVVFPAVHNPSIMDPLQLSWHCTTWFILHWPCGKLWFTVHHFVCVTLHCIAFFFSPFPRCWAAGKPLCDVGRQNFSSHRFSNSCLGAEWRPLLQCWHLGALLTFKLFSSEIFPWKRYAGLGHALPFCKPQCLLSVTPPPSQARPCPPRDGWWWLPASTCLSLPSGILSIFYSLSWSSSPSPSMSISAWFPTSTCSGLPSSILSYFYSSLVSGPQSPDVVDDGPSCQRAHREQSRVHLQFLPTRHFWHDLTGQLPSILALQT